MSSTTGSRDFGRFDELAEEFAKRYRRGERPSLEEYIDRLPEMAHEIREMFPALVEVEQVEGDARDDAHPPPPPSVPRLRQIGDYRIVREVGRGGMGVVYEAEQISLGRRVALKVLPGHVVGDRKALGRFRREARAAARLHHTNIVPVFEVGRDGDVAFYAMQFIQGQGLDQVIDELRRLGGPDRKSVGNDRAGSGGPVRPAVTIPSAAAAAAGPRNRKLGQVAESLLSGRLGTEGLKSSTGAASATMEATETEPFDPAATTDAESRDMGQYLPETPPAADVSTSAVLPGGTAISSVESSGRRLPFFRSVAQIGRQAAQGLAYAHARGVVHRDIKPSNLLLDTAGVVWITDFGLAKAEDDGLTATGDILGTLRFMAPERFRGEGDARADIYALGLTLYELLTLRPAFDTSDRLKLIERIKAEEPARPRSLDGRIPRDLETIVLKASDKVSERRYATAEAMAEDLRRFLADEPIQARRASTAERYARWARRNPAIAVLGGVLTAVLVLATVGSLLAARRFARLADRTQAALVKSQTLASSLALERALVLCAQGDSARGLLWLARSLQLTPSGAADLERVIRLNLHAWSWQMPLLRCVLPVEGPVVAEAFSLDGQRILAIGKDGVARRFDAETGRFLDEYFRHPGPVVAAFNAGGKIAVTVTQASGDYRIWDTLTGQPLGPVVTGAGRAAGCSVSPDGKRLAILGAGDTVRIWDAETGGLVGRPMVHAGFIAPVAWSPDGRWIVTGCQDGAARLWDATTGDLLGKPLPHAQPVSAVAISPDGKTIVTGCEDSAVRFWDSATRQLSGRALPLEIKPRSLQFSQNGRWLVTGSVDDMARVWDTHTRALVGCPLEHQDPVNAVSIQPSGSRLLTRGGDSEVKAWELPDERSFHLVHKIRHSPSLRPVVFNRSADKLLLRGSTLNAAGGAAYLWDLATNHDSGFVFHQDLKVRAGAFSSDGHFAVTGSGLLGPNNRIESGDVRRWDLGTGQLLGEPLRFPTMVLAVAVSPDSRLVLVGCSDGAARLFDAATGQSVGEPMTHSDGVLSVAISRDGSRAVTTSRDRTVRIWEVPTGRPIGQPLPHNHRAVVAAFSPDGNWLATGSMGSTARLWEVASGRPVGRPLTHDDEVTALTFSLDGTLLLTGSDDRTARFWDRATGWPVGPALRHSKGLYVVTFDRDGQTAWTGSGGESGEEVDAEIYRARVPEPKAGDREQVRKWCEAVTGLELDKMDAVNVLDAKAWRDHRQLLPEHDPSAPVDRASP